MFLLGVIPSTDFLKNSGVPLSSRGDVIVDKVSDMAYPFLIPFLPQKKKEPALVDGLPYLTLTNSLHRGSNFSV